MIDPRAQAIERERDRQRQLMVASLIGLASAGLTAAGAAILWQCVAVPEVRALVWPVFAIMSFLGLVCGAFGGVVQAVLGLMFSRESGRKVAKMVEEARSEKPTA